MPMTRAVDPATLYDRSARRKYLNAEERRRFLAVASRLETRQRLFALTLFWTGARLSEVLALTLFSFQVADGLVAISTLKRRRTMVREMPLEPDLVRDLDRTFGLNAGLGVNSREGVRRLWPWSRTTGYRLVKRIMHEAGITGPQACPRGLRHGFGVAALAAGVPLTLLQRWMGHASLRTTSIYLGVSGAEERAFAERVWTCIRPNITNDT